MYTVCSIEYEVYRKKSIGLLEGNTTFASMKVVSLYSMPLDEYQ